MITNLKTRKSKMVKKKINTGEYLKRHGIKPSLQRIKIYEYLIRYNNHPTVDMIYKELVNEIPTLSKTTVYNTLSMFNEKDIISLVTIEDNEIRYDADTDMHGHFKCVNCGTIYDLTVKHLEIELENMKTYDTIEKHVYIKGTCENCKKRS